MKKKTLLMALTLPLCVLQAQNLIVNGDFENTQNLILFEHNESAKCIEVLPGWDMKSAYESPDFGNEGLNRWNVYAEVRYFDDYTTDPTVLYDEDLISDDNFQFVRLKRYEWNGWTTGSIQQTLTVKPGASYSFSFLYSYRADGEIRTNASEWAPEIERYVQVYENEVGGVPLYTDTIFQGTARYENWKVYTATVTIPNSTNTVVVLFGMNNYGGDDASGGKGTNVNVFFDLDDVSLTEQVSALNDASNKQIKVLKNDEAHLQIIGGKYGDKITVYSAEGRLMNSAIADNSDYAISVDGYPQGIYVVRVNDASFKVVL